jgi:hypothetical protein
MLLILFLKYGCAVGTMENLVVFYGDVVRDEFGGVYWYVENVSIIIYAPYLFYTNLYIIFLHFVTLLYIFQH